MHNPVRERDCNMNLLPICISNVKLIKSNKTTLSNTYVTKCIKFVKCLFYSVHNVLEKTYN